MTYQGAQWPPRQIDGHQGWCQGIHGRHGQAGQLVTMVPKRALQFRGRLHTAQQSKANPSCVNRAGIACVKVQSVAYKLGVSTSHSQGVWFSKGEVASRTCRAHCQVDCVHVAPRPTSCSYLRAILFLGQAPHNVHTAQNAASWERARRWRV